MSKSPAKVSVECPHCGFKQQEYAAARSTICRQCSSHYDLGAEKATIRLAPVAAAESGHSEKASLFSRVESLWHRQRNEVVECFECKAKQEVSSSASSTICPQCSGYIDLQDYKITTSFSRNIRTRGAIHLTAKGELSSSNVICNAALIEGKLRGSLHCDGEAKINFSGKILGGLSARSLIVDKKSDVQFFRQLKVGTIDIRGRMSGEIVAEGSVTIQKHGTLDGNVTARSINVEKGGKFSGQLVIGQPLQQAELLPGALAASESEAGVLSAGLRVVQSGRRLPAAS